MRGFFDASWSARHYRTPTVQLHVQGENGTLDVDDAGNYYYTGERMLPPGEQKLAIYRKSLRCSQEGLKRRYPSLEFCRTLIEHGFHRPALVEYTKMSDIISHYVHLAIKGEISVDGALRNMSREISTVKISAE